MNILQKPLNVILAYSENYNYYDNLYNIRRRRSSSDKNSFYYLSIHYKAKIML